MAKYEYWITEEVLTIKKDPKKSLSRKIYIL